MDGMPLPATVAFRKNAWTPDELRRLRSLFDQDVSFEEIAGQLERPLHGVRSKACDLGLRRNSKLPWSRLEEEYLFDHYGTQPASEIALFLGRSPSAVYARATSLGLTQGNPPPWTDWEDDQLRNGYEKGVAVIRLAAELGRPPSGVNSRAHSLGIKHANGPKQFSPDDETRLLELAESGLQYSKIADLLNRSKSTVKGALKRLGYERGWGKPWSVEEENALRVYYKEGKSLPSLALRLGRSADSLRWKAGNLGLSGTHPKPNGFRQGPDWTPEDDAFLRDNYHSMKAKDIATALGRPKAGIYNRAFHMGLKSGFHKDWTPETDKVIGIAYRNAVSLGDLSKLFGCDITTLSKRAAALGFQFSTRTAKAPKGPRNLRPALTMEAVLAMENGR